MKKKTLIDFITSICLIVVGSITLVLPLLKVDNIKYIFIGVMAFYGIMNLFKFILTSDSKDYEGLFTMVASIVTLVFLGFMDINNNPLNLALTLFIWISCMSLIKLKKCDYYHDRHKKIWILKIVTLILFILIGLLTVVNLYYEAAIQVLVLGFFYFTHGILEMVDPITNYLLEMDGKK